ncbi:hypothetical protein EIP91_004938 [Steccherinum ochraceum]|uniref:Extracellular membrane protein CFEM domain-containing protein n=1 Tax=Steccherinum ochraceum TaxID=92696 RepID=A0A4V2MVT6_9APHY|nr:hypothetical protein EIP91_004938 [Steccherinum ochraceum]
MFVISLVSAALLAGQVSASAIEARTPIEKFIYARQTSGFNPAEIPQQCQSTCAATASVLTGQGCQTNACLCTTQVNSGFQQCLNCILALAPPDASLVQQSQQALSQYEDACGQVGLPVSSLLISGATAEPTQGSGSGSLSLPPNTSGTGSASIFFGSTPSADSTPTNTSPPSASTPTRSVIGPSDTSAASPPATSGSAGSGSGAASGGERVFATMTGVLGAGVVGAMMVFGF